MCVDTKYRAFGCMLHTLQFRFALSVQDSSPMCLGRSLTCASQSQTRRGEAKMALANRPRIDMARCS